jgi:hypothetical protein
MARSRRDKGYSRYWLIDGSCLILFPKMLSASWPVVELERKTALVFSLCATDFFIMLEFGVKWQEVDGI